MSIEFLSPAWLFSALAIPLLWWGVRKRGGSLHRLLRSAALLALAFALARPVWWGADGALHSVLVLDRSASVQNSDLADLQASAARWASELPDNSRASLVLFGGEEELTGEWSARFTNVSTVRAGLTAGLAEASRRIPDGARGSITLATDGLSDVRDWGPVVQSLSSREIPVHTTRQGGMSNDLRPVRLEALGEWRVGEEARLAVTVLGKASELTLVLEGAGGEVARSEHLALDGRGRFELAFEPTEAGFLQLSLTASAPGDARISSERIEGHFAVQDPLRVLYLGGRHAGGVEHLAKLVGDGFSFTRGPRAESSGLSVAGYDLVMLDDTAADSLPPGAQEELRDAVLAGTTGLFMAGGQASFGPGGYAEGALADVLPVESVQKEEKRDPSTALVIVIDTSGSMGGERVQLAKEVSRLAIGRLLPHDKVGIVEFYGAKRWAAPLQPASNRIELQRALNRMDAGGGTVILPAIEESFYGLQNVQTRYKHVLVLTDGGVERGAFEPLVRRMADKGITVSTVLIGGAAHSEFLVNIANWGKGRFYSVPDRFSLPEILLKQPTTSKLPAYRPGVHAVEATGPVRLWGDVAREDLPPLAGYVETKARPEAEVLLRTTAGTHPVLASWRTGLGRATAMMTEPTGAGTASWSEWPGYGPLLARLLASTAADARREWSYELQREGVHARLVATRLIDSAGPPRAREWTDVGVREFGFEVLADGLFEARWVADPQAAVLVLAGPEGDAVRHALGPLRGLALDGNVDSAGALDLARLAAATGGLAFAPGALATFGSPPGGPTRSLGRTRLAPLALLLALLLYLLDILHRRRPRTSLRHGTR